MREIYDGPHNRKILYGGGGATALLLLLAGMVWKPEPPPPPTLQDLKVDLAIHLNYGLDDEALQDVEKILDRCPEDVYARLSKAYLFCKAGDKARGLEEYTKSLALPGLEAGVASAVMQDCARLALACGRLEEARDFAKQGMARYGEDVPSKLIYALSSLLLGDDKEFAENVERAVELGGIEALRALEPAELLRDREALERVYIQGALARERMEWKLLGITWI